ncbi:Subtilisin-like protease SBT3 [Camellia lanceoleosa]|uniref:Subtilisin-like protease SBT3 n=1 Tax=Camellia lanceoleosa TaxID=1840588 RepID=A0ACC0IG05_9ERIC|nr:Subtilisin-like protease SBT3 [Camellia lanceoleosa]
MLLVIDLPLHRSSIFFIIFTWFLFIHHVRSTAVERSTYIIHMDKSLMPKAFTTHHHWYSSTVDSLKQSAPTTTTNMSNSISPPSPSVIYTYDNVAHGFCALLSQNELEAVKKSLGFVSAYNDRELKLRTTHTPEFLSLNPSSGLWPASNYGKDVIVGVVDSGVWPESLSFKDDGMTSPIPAKWKGTCEVGQEFNASMCNSKLIGARYFNKGLIASKPHIKISMKSARDTEGHGTHTASTVAGNFVENVSFFGYAEGTARGLAPRARLAVYKVYSHEGFKSSDLLAGIDQAVADGVDILSLSIGFDYVDLPFYENTIAIACFGAMEKGVFVAHAGGNTGPEILSLYDSIPWTTTVAASSIDRLFAGTVTLGNGLTITGWSVFPASALVEKLPLFYNKTVAFCNSTELLAQVASSIIICEDIGDVLSQLRLISSLNVPAVIFISDKIFERSAYFPWPGVVISTKDGHAVIKYAKTKHNPLASMKFKQTVLGTKPAPVVASYSSRGPSRTYTGLLKPDLMAPGSQVLAAWIPIVSSATIGFGISLSSDYNIVTGTSMACPHVAGVAALLKGAHPEWSPAAIRSAMMTTANPIDNTGNLIQDYGQNNTFASPLAMGSGQIDPNKALDPGLVYDTPPQDYVNVLCYMNYTKKQILTITRSNRYNCSKPSPDLNYPSFIAFYNNKSTTMVQTFQRTLTNVGDGLATYYAKIMAPTGSKVRISPRMLIFNGKYDRKSYTLSIECKSNLNGTMTYGSLVWIEDSGTHMVRSPIVLLPKIHFNYTSPPFK